jgi:quercetin 2,3-dioxygenase
LHAPPQYLATKTTLFDVTLQPNTTIEFDAKEMVFVYLMLGEIVIGDREISSTSMITFEKEGDKIKVSTKTESANFMFVSGTPHNEPIVYGGSFVMTANEQMLDTQMRSRSGEMGVLNHL